jgi:pimeloyl-ACP methyl ester carboxylesterase
MNRGYGLLGALMAAACGISIAATPDLPRRSFLGVQAAPVTEDARAQLGIKVEHGVLVTGLVDGGSAKAAGLHPNDVILSVDGHDVADPGQLVARLGAHRAGERATIRWMRDGTVVTREIAMQPRPMESGPGTRTEYSAVSVDGSLRRTIVTGPDDGAKHPAVLYITGIGCFSQESLGAQSGEAKLLHGLARAGFVTMRVEKSGVGDSRGPACDSPQADLRAETAGYVEGMKALKALPQVDRDRVFILGLSLGGVHAPLIAKDEPVRGVVVVNTLARNFMEYLLETRRRQGLLKPEPYDVLDAKLRLTEACNHAMLIDRQKPEAILAARPECEDTLQYAAPYTLMQQWAAIDLSAQWKRVAAPVLIVQGETDFVATVADAPLLRDIVESFHPGHATLVTIPGMDHFLSKAGSMRESMARGGPGDFEPKVLETISGWLREKAAG